MSSTYYVLSKKKVMELHEQYKQQYAKWKKELDETDWRWRPSGCTCKINECVEYKDQVLVDCQFCLRMEWVGRNGEKGYEFCMSLCDADPHKIDIAWEVILNANPYIFALFPRCMHCDRPSSYYSLGEKNVRVVDRDHECPGC